MKNKVPLVLFDMDGVLVHERSSWRVIHRSLGTSNEDSFKAYMSGEIDDLEFMRRDIERWRGSRPDLNRDLIFRILKQTCPMRGFPDRILGMRDQGVRSMIVSGGIDLLADHLSKVSGMAGSFANGIEFDAGGIPTGRGILKVPLRDKGSVVTGEILPKNIFHPIIAVGDSEVDITMFRKADVSIAFRPENKKVRESADIVMENGDLYTLTAEIERIIDRFPQ